MSDDDYLQIKFKILEMFASFDEAALANIEQWLGSKSYKRDLKEKILLLKSDKMLVKIANTIKKMVPFEAEMPSENITTPTVGDQTDCTKTNTCHVDEFLYDEDEVEELVRKKKLSRQYCLDCKGRNLEDLIYISHSTSREMLQFIFKVLVPLDLADEQVLDVGSRLGAVLYGAYYYSNAGKIVGVEMNKECFEVQECIVNKYNMKSRINIVHSDIMERSDLVASSHVIIINVLDFFVDIETHKKIWYFFKQHIKKGSYLICNRNMNYTLKSLGILEDFIGWLSISEHCQPENELVSDPADTMLKEIHLYKVT